MLKRFQDKWQVKGWRFFLVILCFALGGSLCGWLGRALMQLLAIENRLVWIILYIIVVTLLWPLSVLAVSLPLGQFSFFKQYIRKIFARLKRKSSI
jgi:hypothetical protein